MTVDDIMTWARFARTGEELEYHRGNLMFHRYGTSAAARKVNALAQAMWVMAGAGLVALVQRRTPEGDAAYLAQRTARPMP